MTMERQIRTTQRRLWLNRWLRSLCTCLLAATAAFAAVVLVVRSFDLPWPLQAVAGALAAIATIVSAVWTWRHREDEVTAAAALDEAAGLRERVSSGWFCRTSADPFAQAVVSDAERISALVTPRMHIRIRPPPLLGWTVSTAILAALMFLIPLGWLKRTEAGISANPTALIEREKITVRKRLDEVRDLVAKVPGLEDLKEDLDKPADPIGGAPLKPGDIRHEAVKKIDRLENALKQKRESEEYTAARDLQRMFRTLKQPEAANAPTRKLADSLQKGDFKGAKEEIRALREQLATLKSEQDKELVERLSRQLAELSKQIEQAAAQKNLEQKLQQAGLTPEQMERLLESLRKKDLEQVKRELEARGLDPQQIQKLAEQMKRQQNAGELAKKLAQALSQSAQAGASGEPGEAGAGLAAAEGQLSELEMLEQEMGQLDAALAEVQAGRSQLDQPCSGCNGTGRQGSGSCGSCGGTGRGQQPGGAGMGQVGQGRGGLAPEQQTDVGFKIDRAKVHTGRGAIIGQVQFDGEQVKGEVDAQLVDVVTAAERDASDRINRDRIPRQYQKAVKAYFSDMRKLTPDAPPPPPSEPPAEQSQPPSP